MNKNNNSLKLPFAIMAGAFMAVGAGILLALPVAVLAATVQQRPEMGIPVAIIIIITEIVVVQRLLGRLN